NDLGGNWCTTFRTAATPGVVNGGCTQTTVVINEVLIDVTGPDDLFTFIELAGPGGALVGGLALTDVEGSGAAGGRNTDGDFFTGETDGTIVIPAGTRMPADGILILADANTTVTTTSVANVHANDLLFRDVDLENNGGDALQMAFGTILVDTVGYTVVAGGTLAVNLTTFNMLAMYETATAPFPATNKSIARNSTSTDTNNNFVDFSIANTPTPGALN
ncbi:MAG TPA: hypothetical protein PLF40_31335, partial [Kofleriaceae bacterium]|nr:hypothetical protein [Kofleriaceae bacterium]